MPRYIKPPGMPPEVEAIIDVIGSRVREAIVRELAQRGPCGTAQLQEASGADRSATVRHLRSLESAGLVEADTPAGQRAGRTLVWRLNRANLEAHLDALRAYLLGH